METSVLTMVVMTGSSSVSTPAYLELRHGIERRYSKVSHRVSIRNPPTVLLALFDCAFEEDPMLPVTSAGDKGEDEDEVGGASCS